MNIVRTVPKRESSQWVKLLFEPGPPLKPSDPDPLTYPFAHKLRNEVVGGFLYVSYASEIIGYARIAKIEPHWGDNVGEEDQPISAGDRLVLESPLTPMPFKLTCPPLRQFRYVDTNLHQMKQQDAHAALQKPSEKR